MTGPLDRDCPRCHAPAGQPCTAPSGRKAEPHALRRGVPEHRGTVSIITPELTQQITDLVATGVPIVHAVKIAGIGESTLFRWVALAEYTDDAHAPYRELRESLERARAQAVVKHVGLINKHAEGGWVRRKTERVAPDGSIEREVVYADGDWRASSFLLERGYREFVPRKAVELSTTSEGLAAQGQAQAVLDGPGLDRLAANMRLFRERKQLDVGVVEGEVVE